MRTRKRHSGIGTLTIANAGTVTNSGSRVGYMAGSVGIMTVSSNSTWDNTSFLYVGYSGSGTLEISSGGTVSNTTADIGHTCTSDGEVTAGGANSTWATTKRETTSTNSTWSAYAISLPKQRPPDPVIAKRIATLNIPTATGMDVSANGRRAVVLTYGDAYEYRRAQSPILM